MFVKVYDEIKKIIYENYKFFISFFLLCTISMIPLPYYVNMPGGIIDLSSKIEIDGSYPIEGSFNMAYVSELKGTLPILLLASIRPDWDILKMEEVVYENEDISDANFRDHLMLNEANDNAILYAYYKAGKNVTVTNRKLYVTYVDQEGNTDLEVKDQILKINGVEVNDREGLKAVISGLTIGDRLTFQVNHEGKMFERYAEVYELEKEAVIGVMISEEKELDTDPEIKLHFDASESGPSGGLMMSLAIYNYLVEEDITKGHTIVGTGTIELDGSVGSIGGIEYKLKGAVKEKADLFLVPRDENYEEAIALKEKYGYDIEIYAVSTFEEALEILEAQS